MNKNTAFFFLFAVLAFRCNNGVASRESNAESEKQQISEATNTVTNKKCNEKVTAKISNEEMRKM